MSPYMQAVAEGRQAHKAWILTPPGTPRPLCEHVKDSDEWRGWHDGFEMEVLKGDY